MNHVNRIIQEATDAFPSADSLKNEFILLIEASRGRCLFDARNPDLASTSLVVALPKKFQNLIWIRKGSFVIVEKFVQLQENQPTQDSLLPGAVSKKTFGEIRHVLGKKQIDYLKKQGQWPTSPFFNASSASSTEENATLNSQSDSESDSSVSSSSEDNRL